MLTGGPSRVPLERPGGGGVVWTRAPGLPCEAGHRGRRRSLRRPRFRWLNSGQWDRLVHALLGRTPARRLEHSMGPRVPGTGPVSGAAEAVTAVSAPAPPRPSTRLGTGNSLCPSGRRRTDCTAPSPAPPATRRRARVLRAADADGVPRRGRRPARRGADGVGRPAGDHPAAALRSGRRPPRPSRVRGGVLDGAEPPVGRQRGETRAGRRSVS